MLRIGTACFVFTSAFALPGMVSTSEAAAKQWVAGPDLRFNGDFAALRRACGAVLGTREQSLREGAVRQCDSSQAQ
jgi:hypothetical protein